jgi:hypothetical protein
MQTILPAGEGFGNKQSRLSETTSRTTMGAKFPSHQQRPVKSGAGKLRPAMSGWSATRRQGLPTVWGDPTVGLRSIIVLAA